MCTSSIQTTPSPAFHSMVYVNRNIGELLLVSLVLSQCLVQRSAAGGSHRTMAKVAQAICTSKKMEAILPNTWANLGVSAERWMCQSDRTEQVAEREREVSLYSIGVGIMAEHLGHIVHCI